MAKKRNPGEASRTIIAVAKYYKFTLTQTISSLLFGVQPNDPATPAIVTALLLAVAVLGSYIPAH
jgi:hypothetical protein